MPHGAFFHRGPAEVKRLIIEALQEHFAEHPLYADPDGPGVLIRNKYAKSERHKRQIVVTTASASPRRLGMSADFGGRVYSSIVLARLADRKGTAVEWVTENPFQKAKPRPGIYLVEMDTSDTFRVTPYYTVRHEILYPYVDRADGDKVKAALKNKPVEAGSDMLLLDEHLPLERGRDYEIDYGSGVVTFAGAIPEARMLSAEYRWIGETSEPRRASRQAYDIAALPGVILNFGRKTQEGSQQAVVVMDGPEYVADFWTGRWTVSVSLSVHTQDPVEQDELAEEIAQVFWYWNTERWADQGMALSDPPSIEGGSEAEEDEIANEIGFGNTVTMTVLVDWEAFVPVLRRLRTVNVAGYGLSPFDSPTTALKRQRGAEPDGQFGNLIDRRTLPGKGVQSVRDFRGYHELELTQDLRRYFAGPGDPKLGQIYRELLSFDPQRASDALARYYGSVDPSNPAAPDSPINLPERVPVSEFSATPATDGSVPTEPGVFSEILSLDHLPPELWEELRRRSRG